MRLRRKHRRWGVAPRPENICRPDSRQWPDTGCAVPLQYGYRWGGRCHQSGVRGSRRLDHARHVDLGCTDHFDQIAAIGDPGSVEPLEMAGSRREGRELTAIARLRHDKASIPNRPGGAVRLSGDRMLPELSHQRFGRSQLAPSREPRQTGDKPTNDPDRNAQLFASASR